LSLRDACREFIAGAREESATISRPIENSAALFRLACCDSFVFTGLKHSPPWSIPATLNTVCRMDCTDQRTLAEPIFGNYLHDIYPQLLEIPTRTQRPRAIFISEPDQLVGTFKHPGLLYLNIYHSVQQCLTSQFGTLAPEPTGKAPELGEYPRSSTASVFARRSHT
jgi:hypothetical protein